MKAVKPFTRKAIFRRLASTGIPKPPNSTATVSANAKSKKSSSKSPFDSSFSFQMFLIVGAMGAGYTLGKTSITNDPPPTLFPKGSITPYEDLKNFNDDLNYDRFKRCILRILESKGVEVDVKHGKNEGLYKEKFCNEEIAKLMNDIDGLRDVFFGKNEELWLGKHFKWLPESTDDVSMILKLANEFSVPVYTSNYGRDTSGLGFELDLSNLNTNVGDIGKMTPLDPRLGPLDLFLLSCGFNSYDKSINGVSFSSIKEITAVLADGTVVEAKKDSSNAGENEVFSFLTEFANELCVITNVKVDDVSSSKNDDSSLVIYGTNSTDKLNETINEVSKRLPHTKIAVVDSHNSQTQVYNDYPTFAIFKVSLSELKSLNKKYANGDQGNNYSIECLPLEQLKFPVNLNSGATGILVTDDVVNIPFQALKNPAEKVQGNELTVHQSILRRLKFSMDSKLILNRDLTVRVE